MPAKRKTPYKIKRKASRRAYNMKHRPTMRRVVGFTNHANELPGGRYQFARMLSNWQVFPTSVVKNLIYCDQIQLSSSAATNQFGTRTAYRLNSLFDPDLDNVGTNHQPYFWDQISGLYAYYRVYEVAWEITFTNPSTVNVFVGAIITPSADTFTITGKQHYQIREKPGAVSNALPDAGTRSYTISGTQKIWDIEGIPYQNWIGNSGYQATVGASPAGYPVLQVAIGDFLSPMTQSTAIVLVKIVYRARLFTQQTQTYS